MRTRDWRRFQEEKIYRRRIKRFGRAWYYFHTANGDKLKNPIWVDFIGLPDYNFYKTGTTKKYDTKSKVKYSPNKSNSYYRDRKKGQNSYGNREKDNQLAKKLIQDGLSEYYTQ
jgi:hypothetical protein